jgi:hypothetical protein
MLSQTHVLGGRNKRARVIATIIHSPRKKSAKKKLTPYALVTECVISTAVFRFAWGKWWS